MAEKKKISEIDVEKVNKKKLGAVGDIINLINSNRVVVIVSIKNLPTSQFQLIKKKLRGKAIVKVIKKTIINRAIDKIEKGTIKNLKKYFKEDQAIIFSELDPFELSGILSKNKSYARAKIGQKVDEDIVVEAGPTELVPGPVVSELGNLGIKFAIENGKINIRNSKTILKAGEAVNEAAVSIMSKFDMKPIAVGLVPEVAYDSKEDKIFEDIGVDEEKMLEEMRTAYSRALGFAVKIVYVCKESISFLLRKAASEEKALSGLIKEEKTVGSEEGKEKKTGDKEERKPEGEAAEATGEKETEKAEDIQKSKLEQEEK